MGTQAVPPFGLAQFGAMLQHVYATSSASIDHLEGNEAKRARFDSSWQNSPESSQSSHSEDAPPVRPVSRAHILSSAFSDDGAHTEDDRPSTSSDLLTIGEESETHTDSGYSGHSSAPTPDLAVPKDFKNGNRSPISIQTGNGHGIYADAKFSSFSQFEEAFDLWKSVYHHPFRVASSETLREPDGSVNEVFKYRYIVYHCAHYGAPRMRGVGKRPNQNYLPCGCKAMLRLNYNFNEKVLKVTTLNDVHVGHELSAEKYAYITKKMKKSPSSSAEPSPSLKRKRGSAKMDSPMNTPQNTQTPTPTSTTANTPLRTVQQNGNAGAEAVQTGWNPAQFSPNLAALMAAQHQRMAAAAMVLQQQQKESIQQQMLNGSPSAANQQHNVQPVPAASVTEEQNSENQPPPTLTPLLPRSQPPTTLPLQQNMFHSSHPLLQQGMMFHNMFNLHGQMLHFPQAAQAAVAPAAPPPAVQPTTAANVAAPAAEPSPQPEKTQTATLNHSPYGDAKTVAPIQSVSPHTSTPSPVHVTVGDTTIFRPVPCKPEPQAPYTEAETQTVIDQIADALRRCDKATMQQRVNHLRSVLQFWN